MQVLMSTVNISEGKNRDIIDKVQAALMAEGNLTLSQVSIDPDHNRTCYSYRGEAKDMLEGTKRLAKTAIELIDMTTHHGEHPRMGAVDVVPFIPVSGITIEEAKVYAVEFGKYVASLGVPVYYYEENSNNPDRKLLTQIRKGEEVLVRSLHGSPELCARLQEYGFTPGCAVRLFAKAPLGGPMSFDLRGGRVALRRNDAACIQV